MTEQLTTISISIDEELKQEAAAVLEKFNLTISDAVRMLMKRIVVEKSLPIALLADKETYESWFKAQLDEAIKSPLSEISYESLLASYREKHNT